MQPRTKTRGAGDVAGSGWHVHSNSFTGNLGFTTDVLFDFVQSEIDAGRFEDALTLLQEVPVSTAADRQRAHEFEAIALHGLAKREIAHGNRREARHQLNRCKELSGSRSLRSLAQRRIDLLDTPQESFSIGLTAGQEIELRMLRESVRPALHLANSDFQPHVDAVYCLGAYRSGYDPHSGNRFSKAVRNIKDGGQDWLVDALGELLVDHLAGVCDVLDDVDMVVPVPTDPARHRSRGYGIPDKIARRIEARFSIPVVQILAQTREAPELRRLPRWARPGAVEDLFSVPKSEWVAGRGILLVDDVTTTGSTLREIAGTLQDEQARAVYAAVLAHTERSL